MFVVYAIKSCVTERIYIGQTHNFEKRLLLHNQGSVKSTVNDRPWELIAMEVFETRDNARWRERQLKTSRGRRTKWLEDHNL